MDLILNIQGEIVESNFADFRESVLTKIEAINLDLKTDEDFHEAKKIVKSCLAAEKAIDEAREKAMAKTASISELFQFMEELKSQISNTRLKLDKQVKVRQKEVKEELVKKGIAQVWQTINDSDVNDISKDNFKFDTSVFQDAVKGRRKLEPMIDAVNQTVVDILEEFDKFNNLVSSNLTYLARYENDYPTLFTDIDRLATMEQNSLTEIVAARISRFAAEEKLAQEKAEREAKEKQEAEEAKKKAEEESVNEPELETQPGLFQPLDNPGPGICAPTDYSQDLPPAPGPAPELAPAPEPAPVQVDMDKSYRMTVIFQCPREKAIEIAETVNFALEDYADEIVSIDLSNNDEG
jgi:hypothetical protein